jgi:hypothetical protein
MLWLVSGPTDHGMILAYAWTASPNLSRCGQSSLNEIHHVRKRHRRTDIVLSLQAQAPIWRSVAGIATASPASMIYQGMRSGMAAIIEI